MHIKAWDLLYQRIVETLENKPKTINPITREIQEYDYSAKDMSELAKALDKLQSGHRKAENVIDAPTLKKLELDREKFEHDKQSNTDKVINVISNIPRPPAGGDEE